MTWSDLLFAHWPVAPELLKSYLPTGMELDTRDGLAWIGVVPFLMSGVAPRCVPSMPGVSRFLELNVRTYVVRDGKPLGLELVDPPHLLIARPILVHAWGIVRCN